MPRHQRLRSESKIYHIMVRGNERKRIYLDEEDKNRYVETLARITGHSLRAEKEARRGCPAFYSEREKTSYIYAYCLMDNHAHLLINEGNDEISRIMKRIGTSYVNYFNKKYERVGHLFQDRFRSEAIGDGNYLLSAARYIHNNPVKAGIVRKASDYPWSSYNQYIEERTAQNFIEKSMILDILSPDTKRAVELLIQYTEEKNSDEFLEDNDKGMEEKMAPDRGSACDFIEGFLDNKKISMQQLHDREYIAVRTELIGRLRNCSKLSVREVAALLNVNRGVVQRIK